MVKRFMMLASFLGAIIGLVAGCKQYTNLGDDYPTRCPGQCLPLPPLGFDGPALLWAGDAAEVPVCPDRAPAIVFEGYEGLRDLPLGCSPCECSPPRCQLPAGVVASTLPTCPYDSPGATLTPFPAPASWDGTCASAGTVDPDLLGSLGLLQTTQEPCAPVVSVPEKTEPGPPFTIRARACGGEVKPDLCDGPGLTCVPTDEPPPPGFRQCILSLREGEAACPPEYPEEVSFFAKVTDDRGCAPCSCAQISTSTCVADVRAFQDGSCSGAAFVQRYVDESGNCAEVFPGTTLRSIDASWFTNQPGACVAAGGAPTGQVTLTGLQTFCCQKPPS